MKTQNTKTERSLRATWRRSFAWCAAAIFILSTAGTVLLPLFSGTAEAGPTGGTPVNLIKRGSSSRDLKGARIHALPPVATCEPYFSTERKTGGMMDYAFATNSQRFIDQSAQLPSLQFNTFLGWKPTGDDASTASRAAGEPQTFISNQHVRNAVAGLETSDVTVIRFQPSSGNPVDDPNHGGPAPGGGGEDSAANICGQYIMVPISTTEWRGFELTDSSKINNTIGHNLYMRFNLSSGNTGTFNFYGKDYDHYVDDGLWQLLPRTFTMTIPGNPGGGGPGTVNTGTVTAKWNTAGKITVVSGGSLDGEVYQKSLWGGAYGWSIYHLTTLGSKAPEGRTAILGAGRCDTPFPIGSTCNPTNCVPFIAVGASLSFDPARAANDGSLQYMQTQQINKLGSTTEATLIDYQLDPATGGCKVTGTHKVAFTGDTQTTSRTWFYYKKSSDSFSLVFSQTFPGGSETPYFGTYTKIGTTGIWSGGASGCEGVITITSGNPASDTVLNLRWRLVKKDTQCTAAQYYDSNLLNVYALGGAEGEAGADAVQAEQPSLAAVSQPSIGCNSIADNPLRWIICPVLNLMVTTVNRLDTAINTILTVDVDKIFNDDKSTGFSYHTAWASFRTFALTLIVIAALLMVIAQAAGMEVLDAYTVRKTLPRLIIAAIAITLSWQLMELAVIISNDLGNAVRYLIYAPFSKLSGSVNLTNLGASIGSLFIIGGAIAYGVFGLISLAITAFLAVLVAFLILTFRVILIAFLALVSPMAIACSILPGTQKVYKLWANGLMGALLVYVIISAFIATGRVFSVTALTGSETGEFRTLWQVVGLVAYFIPYFLIPFAFRLAGGFIGTVGGLVNDKSRGAFDRLKNQRAGLLKGRGKKMKEGNLYTGSGLIPGSRTLARSFNRVSAGVATGGRGHFGLPTARGSAAVGQTRFGAADELRKSAEWHNIAEQDDVLHALTYASQGEAMAGLQARAGWDRARARSAVAGAQASGVGFGAPQQLAAAKALIDTGTGYDNMQDWITTAARASRGNGSALGDVIGYGNAKAKGNRMDLTPGFGESLAAAQRVVGGQDIAQGEWDRLTVRAIRNSGAPTTVVGQGKEQVFQNFAEASTRLDAAQAGALPGYGLSGADMVQLQDQIDAGAMELDAANYASGSVLGSEHSFGVIQARVAAGGPVRNPAAIDAARGAGQARIFGNTPGGPPIVPPSDRRLKRDVRAMGTTASAIPIYQFRYLWGEQEYVGVMAQDLLTSYPEAVIVGPDGYYRVDYGLLGMTFQTLEEWQQGTSVK